MVHNSTNYFRKIENKQQQQRVYFKDALACKEDKGPAALPNDQSDEKRKKVDEFQKANSNEEKAQHSPDEQSIVAGSIPRIKLVPSGSSSDECEWENPLVMYGDDDEGNDEDKRYAASVQCDYEGVYIYIYERVHVIVRRICRIS